MSHLTIVKAASWFFDELERRGVLYAILRKAELVPENIGNDVDILIGDGEEDRVAEAVSDVAKRFSLRLYKRKDVPGLYFILYGFDGGKLIFLRLDFSHNTKEKGKLLSARMLNEKGLCYLPAGLSEKKPKRDVKKFFTYPWRLLFPRGRFIVFVGPDGVGKSTTAGLLAQILEALHVPVTHMHLGFRPRILPTKRSIVSMGKEKNAVPGEKSETPGLLRFLYYSLDYFLGYFFRIRPLLVKGRMVIGERYYYNYLVDPRPRKELGFPGWLPRLIYACMPKPDVLVLLSNDAQAIFARRQEHSREEIERQIVEYRWAGKKAKRFLEVRTDKPPAEVAMEVAGNLIN